MFISRDLLDNSKMSKFEKFHQYLSQVPEMINLLYLTFDQLAWIIETTELCDAAHKHDAYFSNNDSHPFPKRWLALGWEKTGGGKDEKYIILERKKSTHF